MNELEMLLVSCDKELLESYLGLTTVTDFIKHINEIKAKTADKEFVKMAITNLQTLL